ncbi:MAG TPA: hypothetical protein DCY31_04420 [Ruminococcaceae bacterium]|nr:hypothetical protein [Oscillospiraceae bacterium]
MKKFIFFPLWRLDELENKLSEMERSGYRLVKVSFLFWFTFVESKSKDMRYYMPITVWRDRSMYECDHAISRNGGHAIECRYCYFSIYRTSAPKEKISLLYGARMDYVKSVLLHKILLFLAGALLFLFVIIAEHGRIPRYDFIKSISAVIIFSLFAGYNLYGYFKQRNKCKKFEKEEM